MQKLVDVVKFFEILLRKSWSSQCQLKASKYIARISWCTESFLKYYSERAEVANINWKIRNMLQELLDVVKVIWNMIESQPTLDKKKLEFLSEKRTSRDIWSTRGGGVKISKKIRTSFLNPPWESWGYSFWSLVIVFYRALAQSANGQIWNYACCEAWYHIQLNF